MEIKKIFEAIFGGGKVEEKGLPKTENAQKEKDAAAMKELRDVLVEIISKANLAGKAPLVSLWQSALRMYDSRVPPKVSGRPQEYIIGVYGTPKMGKSTLLNSIAGEVILPYGDTPETGAIIDLRRDEKKDFYDVFCYKKENGVEKMSAQPKSFRSAEAVCNYLKSIAGQNLATRHERVEIKGPFHKARTFFRSGYILRDTPGAITGEACKKELAEDSRLSLASLADVFMPLFCVNAETLQQGSEVALYKEHFITRVCLHVLTHCDESANDEEFLEAFRNTYGICEGDKVDEKIMVCTGMESKDNILITRGLEELEKKIDNYLEIEKLQELLEHIGTLILEQCEAAPGHWNATALGFPIPVVLLEKLKMTMAARVR